MQDLSAQRSREFLPQTHSRENIQRTEALVRKYRPTIVRLAFSILGSEIEAEDIAQEVCINIFRYAWKAERDPKWELAWVKRITWNKCKQFMAYESAKKRDAIKHSIEIPSIASQLVVDPWDELYSIGDALQGAIESFVHPSTYDIFYRYSVEGEDPAILAKEYGTTNIKSSVFRARHKMRDYLTERKRDGVFFD